MTKKKNGTATLTVEYLGFDEYIDAQIRELVGLPLSHSGFCALDGMRDLNFEGPEKKIEAAETLLHSVRLSNEHLPQLTVSVE